MTKLGWRCKQRGPSRGVPITPSRRNFREITPSRRNFWSITPSRQLRNHAITPQFSANHAITPNSFRNHAITPNFFRNHAITPDFSSSRHHAPLFSITPSRPFFLTITPSSPKNGRSRLHAIPWGCLVKRYHKARGRNSRLNENRSFFSLQSPITFCKLAEQVTYFTSPISSFVSAHIYRYKNRFKPVYPRFIMSHISKLIL